MDVTFTLSTEEELQKVSLRAPSEDWVDGRREYLGSTDISAILGLHPYKSARQVYMEKKGLVGPIPLNEKMVHGQNLELYVSQLYSKLTGRKLHKSKLYQHKSFPFLAANPDYEIRGERPLRLLECKTAGHFAGAEFRDSVDAIPDQYLCQVMWQLAITGRQVCDLAVLIGGQDFRIYTVERDDALVRRLLEDAVIWWHSYIVNDVPPPLTGDEPDCNMIKQQYPDSNNGDSIYATEAIDDLCLMLRESKEAKDSAAKEQARIENCIKEYMRDAGAMTFSEGVIYWRSDVNGSRRFVTKFKERSKLQNGNEQQRKDNEQQQGVSESSGDARVRRSA